ncbi:MAG: 3-hydroxyacyl-ACP dehydratase FabZ [Lachnospiraceae bacterium]|nr:3-hydroxyacyl-ACP dehydratase FabZ [Lachnospiraceae bacterium]
MNRDEIRAILPHREPMLLLDDVAREGGTSVGHYTVRGDEFFLQGHFPGQPIVPGVIQLEILAQSACVLLRDRIAEGKLTLYTGLNNVRFRNPVRPGDTIETRVEITRAKDPFYFAKGTARVDGKVCVSAEFSFAVTEAPAPAAGTREAAALTEA